MTEMLERLAKALGDVAYGYVDRVATPNKWDTAMALARVAVDLVRGADEVLPE